MNKSFTALNLTNRQEIVLASVAEFIAAKKICWFFPYNGGSKVLVERPPTLSDWIHGQKHNYVYVTTSDSPTQIQHKLSNAEVKTVTAEGNFFTPLGAERITRDHMICPGWHGPAIVARHPDKFRKFMLETASPMHA